jgi:putative FmdB family regulatory protein
MPLFEYTCRACGHRFETFVSASRTPHCPKCESVDLEKVFSTFGTRSGGAPAGSRFT